MFYDLSKFYDYILETINSYRFLNAQQGGTQLGLDPRSGSQWDSLNESLWQKNPEITGFSDLWSEHFSFISEISNSSFLYLVIFYFFAISAIISGFFVIVSVNPMHSVFSLVLTFLNTSIILLLLGVEFLAFLFLIVYVGAIAILFLFVVMMLNIRIVELIENTTRYIPIGLILGIIFFIELSIFKDPQAFNIQEVNISDIGGAYTFEMPRLTGLSDVVGENIREADIFEKTSPESEVSLQKAFLDPLSGTQLGWELDLKEIELLKEGSDVFDTNITSAFGSFNSLNIFTLGQILYTKYFIYFLVSSVVLLVAMIGAIVLTLHHETEVKRQDIFSQISTSYNKTIRLRSSA